MSGKRMKNLGKVFKELRESRKISLRKATGGRFSASLLSRFENGQSEISAPKLITALENIHASMEELLFLARGFHQDAYSEFRNRIVEAQTTNTKLKMEAPKALKNRDKLKTLYA